MTYRTQEVCKKLEYRLADEIQSVMDGESDVTSPISYKIFEHILMDDGWILSHKTCKNKWELLVNMGVITRIPYTDGMALINVEKLAVVLGYISEKKNKKINFEIVDAEEVRA